MYYCPSCRAGFSDDAPTCASCDCPTVRELEPEVETPLPEPPLSLLVRADILSAGIIENELEEHGIRCYIEPGSMISLTGMAYARLIVSQKDAHQSATVLEDLHKRHPNLKIDYTGQSETPAIPNM